MDVRTEGSPGAIITLLYVRPASDLVTELDQRVGAIARRYERWVELRVVGPDQLASQLTHDHAEQRGRALGLDQVARAGSPALLLLRGDEVVGEAIGARLPARELDDVVRRAVEWPVPA